MEQPTKLNEVKLSENLASSQQKEDISSKIKMPGSATI
jgi:hypothetical protein